MVPARDRDLPKVLVVRHGMGRGRLHPYNDRFLREVERRRPELWSHLRLYETGDPAPCLEGTVTVVFWVGDPLRELYPEDYRHCLEIADQARALGIRLVNSPERLSGGLKDRASRVWIEAGIPTPRCRRFTDRREFEVLLSTMTFPVVVRGDHLHSQERIQLYQEPDEALACPHDAVPYPGVLSEFVDTREFYRRHDPDSLMARFHHKKRVMIYGDTVVPYNYYLAPRPIVGHRRHTLFGPRYERPGMKGRLLGYSRLLREAVTAELEWFDAGPEAPDLFRTAVHALGLEFAALDYATLGPDRVVLWEANPYPYLSSPGESTLAGPRRLEARERQNVDALANWLLQLASSEPGRDAGASQSSRGS